MKEDASTSGRIETCTTGRQCGSNAIPWVGGCGADWIASFSGRFRVESEETEEGTVAGLDGAGFLAGIQVRHWFEFLYLN